MSTWPPPWLRARMAEVKKAHDPDLVDRIVAGCTTTDTLADAAAAVCVQRRGGGWRALDKALHGGDLAKAPAEIRALVEPLVDPPEWVDLDLADAGATAYWRVGGGIQALALTAGSLAFGYQSGRLVRPLAATGRLEHMARRRLEETSRWVIDATAPGGMHPYAAGWTASVKVRMVHALVRAHLRRDPGWNHADWAEPIADTDGLATAIGGFHIVPLRALRDLGVRFVPAELEAMTHQWRWIAYVMGVPEQLLPRTHAEAEACVDCGLALDEGPNEDSPRLMAALLRYAIGLDRLLPGPAAGPTRAVTGLALAAFVRRWMGDAMADELKVPRTPLTNLVPLLRPLAAARDIARAVGVSDQAIAAAELALVKRTGGIVGRAPLPIAPDDAAQAPVLARAA